MNHGFRVREARASDNDELLPMIRMAPMEADSFVYVDRSPNIFSFPSLQGDSYTFVVAEAEKKLAGSLLITEDSVYYNGRVTRRALLGDVRILPAFRRQKLVETLLGQFGDYLNAGAGLFGVTSILASNEKALRKHHSLGPKIKIMDMGLAHIYELLPLGGRRPSSKFHYRRARWQDLSSITELLDHQYRSYHNAPVLTRSLLEAQLRKHESFTIESLWCAYEGERLVAVMGAWDQNSIRRTVVTRFSRQLKPLVKILNATRFMTGMPRIPGINEPLRTLYLRWPACRPGKMEALHHLLRYVHAHAVRMKQYHVIMLGFHHSDPLKSIVDGFLKAEDKARIFFHVGNKGSLDFAPEVMQRMPIHLDYSLI